MQIITLRQPGSDNLTPADYREIFDELRANRSLRALVETAGAAESRIAYWSRYQRKPAAVPDLAGRNELRRLVGLPELEPVAGDVVVTAADPAAAVWRVGDDGPADRVILLATPGPVTLHVNGDGPQVVDSAQVARSAFVQGRTATQRRKAYWTVRLPKEWRTELESRGLDIRQIIAAALEDER